MVPRKLPVSADRKIPGYGDNAYYHKTILTVIRGIALGPYRFSLKYRHCGPFREQYREWILP